MAFSTVKINSPPYLNSVYLVRKCAYPNFLPSLLLEDYGNKCCNTAEIFLKNLDCYYVKYIIYLTLGIVILIFCAIEIEYKKQKRP